MYCSSFSDKAIEHFMSPRNAGSMVDADGEGSFGDPDCGDFLTIYIKVIDNVIVDISFLVFGFWLRGCCSFKQYDDGTCKGKIIG